MKKSILISTVCILAILTIALVACNQATSQPPQNQSSPGDQGQGNGQASNQSVLIVYFSCTGTTEKVANNMKSVLNCDVFEIEPSVPYTSADLNYSNSSCRANQEQNDATARPQIANSVEDISKYDVILIGYPIWWGKAPKIVYTFLEQYDFSGKIIAPFCTSGSSSVSGSEGDLHAIAPSATWKNGTRFASNATQSTISAWIESLNL